MEIFKTFEGHTNFRLEIELFSPRFLSLFEKIFFRNYTGLHWLTGEQKEIKRKDLFQTTPTPPPKMSHNMKLSKKIYGR